MSPGCLLADEVAAPRAVARIMDRPVVEALLLYTSRVSVDAFMEGFFPEESFGARQELERAFDEELKHMRGPSEEPYLGFPSSTPGELLEVVESVSSDVRYVAVDPDASGKRCETPSSWRRTSPVHPNSTPKSSGQRLAR
jgi:hypothetical protein